MKFLHVTDTHLGYHQYGLYERARDFFDVFNEAVNIAIRENVDFVIHTGDFFHTSRPSNSTLIEGIDIIKKLNSHNIPIFIIPGNHDRGNQVKDVSPLSILKNFGANVLEQDTVEYEGVHITGLKYLSKIAIKKLGSLRPVLEKLLDDIQGNSYFHILLLHQEFSPHFPDGLYLSKELPEGFSYVGIGHLHEKVEPFKVNGATVIYPGSTEYTAFTLNEEKVPKGVYIVNVEEKSVFPEFIPLKTRRPFINMEFEEDTFEESVKLLKEKVKQVRNLSEKLPVVVLRGYVENLSIKDLHIKLSKNKLTPDFNNVLHVHFILKRKEDLEKQKDIFTLMSAESINIEGELKSLLGDEDLFVKVMDIINTAKTMESIDDFKAFLKENEEKIDI